VNAIIVFFSVSGTARAVAEGIAEGLESRGVACALHDLGDSPVPDLGGFEIVGVGSPVHYYRLSAPVEQALRSMGRLDGVASFAFVVHGTYRGKALNDARDALARAGAVDLGGFACHGVEHFPGYARVGYRFSVGHPNAEELDAAHAFGAAAAEAAAAIASGSPAPPPSARDPRTPLLYALERAITLQRFVPAVYSHLFRADPALCTRCARCVRACPKGNVHLRRGETPEWGRDCIMCLACRDICPEGAVRSPIDWAILTPFLRLNVWRAARDAGLDYERVTEPGVSRRSRPGD
jgi:ferredoxin